MVSRVKKGDGSVVGKGAIDKPNKSRKMNSDSENESEGDAMVIGESDDEIEEDDDDDDDELLGLAGVDNDFDEDLVDEEEEEDEYEDEVIPSRKRNSKANSKKPLVSVNSGNTGNISVTMNFNDKKKFSKVMKSKISKPKVQQKLKLKRRPDLSTESSADSVINNSKNNFKNKNKSRSHNKKAINYNEDDDDEEDEELIGEDNEEEEDEIINNSMIGEDDELDEDEEDEDNFDDIGSGYNSERDLSKLSERQRSKILGTSEEPDELSSELYKDKKLPKSVLALMHGNQKKEPLTEEEIQFKKADTARKRKIFVARKLEAEKKETLKKLLYRKVEKADAKAKEEELERRKLNKSKRKELLKHKALFSWVSKTEVVNDVKTNVSYYSMQ